MVSGELQLHWSRWLTTKQGSQLRLVWKENRRYWQWIISTSDCTIGATKSPEGRELYPSSDLGLAKSVWKCDERRNGNEFRVHRGGAETVPRRSRGIPRVQEDGRNLVRP